MKKNEEMKKKEASMKMEICEKDRIICNHITNVRKQRSVTLEIQ